MNRPQLLNVKIPDYPEDTMLPEAWKWLEDQIWDILQRFIRMKKLFITKNKFLSTLDNISKYRDSNDVFISPQKEIEISNYLNFTANIDISELGLNQVYIATIIENMFYQVIELASGGFDEERPFNITDLINGIEVYLTWSIVFARPCAVKEQIRKLSEMVNYSGNDLKNTVDALDMAIYYYKTYVQKFKKK
jgi:hypothetical protein